MHLIRFWVGVCVILVMSACGGGGGNPGTASGGTGTTPVTVTTADPLLSGSLLDSGGVATTSVAASGYTVLSVTLKTKSGVVLPNQLIEVTGDANKVTFPEGGGGLTNASGTATIKVTRASLVASGAGSLTITYSYKAGSLVAYSAELPTTDKVITASVGYQLSTANITLTNLDVGAATLAAYGTRQISVQANVNGVVSSSIPVQVNFTATCGQISPTTASTNSSGIATVSYAATDATGTSASTLGCSGKTVEISASTSGATVVSKTVNIEAAAPTNLSFVAATPTTIFLDNSGGPTQSIVQFKLVNSRGEALLGRDIVLSLRTQVTGALKASFGTVGNTLPVTVTTDASGKVSVPVFSGTVPTSVVVNAALVSDASIKTDSAILTIASGRAAQARVSLSIKALSIEGLNLDGDSTDVTMSLADRQGNPVPDGTAVNFVTEGGVMIPPVCYTGGVKDPATGFFSNPGNSQCSVKIRSQEPRPSNGRVSILAYAAGEEDFVDRNFNNVFDAGDTFTDLGNAFRDDNENSAFDAGEFSVPRTGSTTSGNECPGWLGRPGTCDGAWGIADVRKQAIIIFASGEAVITKNSMTSSNLSYKVSDKNSHSVPTGSTVTVTAVSSSGNCAVISGATQTIPSTLDPSDFETGFSLCATGDQIIVSVKTPLGLTKTQGFTVVAPVSPLAVSSGGTMTISVDEARASVIFGGTAPYSVSSSALATAKVAVTGSALTVTGVAAGSATITVTDVTGTQFKITVTVQ